MSIGYRFPGIMGYLYKDQLFIIGGDMRNLSREQRGEESGQLESEGDDIVLTGTAYLYETFPWLECRWNSSLEFLARGSRKYYQQMAKDIERRGERADASLETQFEQILSNEKTTPERTSSNFCCPIIYVDKYGEHLIIVEGGPYSKTRSRCARGCSQLLGSVYTYDIFPWDDNMDSRTGYKPSEDECRAEARKIKNECNEGLAPETERRVQRMLKAKAKRENKENY